MSILQNNFIPRPTASQMAAQRLAELTQQSFQQMVMCFNEGASVFWTNAYGATPEQIAEELGSDAGEVFYLHARLGELISLVQPEAIAEGLSVVGNFTVNDDGTVTVLPPPQPEVVPEPEVTPE